MSYTRVSTPLVKETHAILVPYGETVGFENEAAKALLGNKVIPNQEFFAARKWCKAFPLAERIRIPNARDLYLAIYVPKAAMIRIPNKKTGVTKETLNYYATRESTKAGLEWCLEAGYSIVVTPLCAIEEEGYDRYDAYDYLSRTCINFSNHHEGMIINLFDLGPKDLRIPEEAGRALTPFEYIKVETAPDQKRHPIPSATLPGFVEYFTGKPIPASPYDFLSNVLNRQADKKRIPKEAKTDGEEKIDLEKWFRQAVRVESEGTFTLRMFSKLKHGEKGRNNQAKTHKNVDSTVGRIFGTVSLRHFIWIARVLKLDPEEARYVAMRIGIPWSDYSEEGWFFYENLNKKKLELCDGYKKRFGVDLIR